MGTSNFVVWNGTVVQPVTITDGVHNVAIASGIPNIDAMGLVVRTAGPQEVIGTVTVSGVNGITVEVSGLTNLEINASLNGISTPVNAITSSFTGLIGGQTALLVYSPSEANAFGPAPNKATQVGFLDHTASNLYIPVMGSQIMNNSIPVALASDQIIPIAGTVSISGVPSVQKVSLTNLDTLVAQYETAQFSEASLSGLAVVTTSEGFHGGDYPQRITAIGAMSFNDSDLQQIKQGPRNMNGSLAVTIATDQTPIPIEGTVNISGVVVEIGFPANQQVFGSVTISGNPQIIAGPLPGAIYPVAGSVTLSGTPTVNIGTLPTHTVNQGVPAVIASGWPTIITDGTRSAVVGSTSTVSLTLTSNGLYTTSTIHAYDTGGTIRVLGTASGLGITGAPESNILGVMSYMEDSGTAAAIISPRNFSGTTLNGTLNSVTNTARGMQTHLGMGWDSTASAQAYRAISVTPTGQINTNITGYPNPLNVQGSVTLSGTPQVIAGPLPGARYPVTGAVTLSGTPSIDILSINGATVGAAGAMPIVGHTGGIVDATSNAATPGSFLIMGGQFNSSLPSITDGHVAPLQVDGGGVLKVALYDSADQGLTSTGGALKISINLPIPAGTNVIGEVVAGPKPGALYPVTGAVTLSGNPAITYATPTTDIYTEASISFSAAGDNVIVSGFGSQTIRVFRIFYVVNGTNNLTYKFGSTAANQVGPMNFVAGSTMVLDTSPAPWFTSVAGSGFIINASSTQSVAGRIYYLQS